MEIDRVNMQVIKPQVKLELSKIWKGGFILVEPHVKEIWQTMSMYFLFKIQFYKASLFLQLKSKMKENCSKALPVCL